MRCVYGFAVLLAAGSLAAQTPGAALPVAAIQAAGVIAAHDIARHVDVIAHDSMLGRDTPSKGLSKTAQYVHNEFSKLGLTTSFQSYPIPGQRILNRAASMLTLNAKAGQDGKDLVDENGSALVKNVALDLAAAARLAVDTVPESGSPAQPMPSRMLVLTGRHTAKTIQQANLHEEAVLYIPPAGIDSATEQEVIDRIYARNSVLILSDDDSATFARRQGDAARRQNVVMNAYIEDAVVGHRWIAYVRPEALGGFWDFAGLDWAEARADTAPTVRQVWAMNAGLYVQPDTTVAETANGTNVIGIIPGTDSTLVNQYVVISAHMDQAGIVRGHSDSIRNGADDDASGVAGLIALAKAFTQPGARPRRSILLLATSGGAKRSWGAHFFASCCAQAQGSGFFASGPVYDVILDINLDRISGAKDSVSVDGANDLVLSMAPSWVAGLHPELQLTVVNGGTVADPRFDHFAFVRRGVPSLYFYNGDHETDSDAADTPAAVDGVRAERVLRLVYFVAQEFANANGRPTWSPEGRQHRLFATGWR